MPNLISFTDLSGDGLIRISDRADTFAQSWKQNKMLKILENMQAQMYITRGLLVKMPKASAF